MTLQSFDLQVIAVCILAGVVLAAGLFWVTRMTSRFRSRRSLAAMAGGWFTLCLIGLLFAVQTVA